MKALIHRAKSFLVSEDGPTATEYAVMLALIIVALMASITILKGKIEGVFTEIGTELDGAIADE